MDSDGRFGYAHLRRLVDHDKIKRWQLFAFLQARKRRRAEDDVARLDVEHPAARHEDEAAGRDGQARHGSLNEQFSTRRQARSMTPDQERVRWPRAAMLE